MAPQIRARHGEPLPRAFTPPRGNLDRNVRAESGLFDGGPQISVRGSHDDDVTHSPQGQRDDVRRDSNIDALLAWCRLWPVARVAQETPAHIDSRIDPSRELPHVRSIAPDVPRSVRAAGVGANFAEKTALVPGGHQACHLARPELAEPSRIRTIVEEGAASAPVEILRVKENDYALDVRSLTQQPRHGPLRGRAGKIDPTVLRHPAGVKPRRAPRRPATPPPPRAPAQR